MSRTYRNRLNHTNCTSEAKFMQKTWINWRTGVPEPINDEGDWDRIARDGVYNSGRCKGYRSATNELIRNRNRVDIQRIKADPENYDDMTFADIHDAKKFIWSFW